MLSCRAPRVPCSFGANSGFVACQLCAPLRNQSQFIAARKFASIRGQSRHFGVFERLGQSRAQLLDFVEERFFFYHAFAEDIFAFFHQLFDFVNDAQDIHGKREYLITAHSLYLS